MGKNIENNLLKLSESLIANDLNLEDLDNFQEVTYYLNSIPFFRLKHFDRLLQIVGAQINPIHPEVYVDKLLSLLKNTEDPDLIALLLALNSSIVKVQAWELRRHTTNLLNKYDVKLSNFTALYKSLSLEMIKTNFLTHIVDQHPELTSIPEILDNKIKTYRSAKKNISNGISGYHKGDEFRELIQTKIALTVNEINQTMQGLSEFDSLNPKKLSSNQTLDFGISALSLQLYQINYHTNTSPLNDMHHGIDGKLNQKKYFIYDLLSEYFPKDYPSDEEIINRLEQNLSTVKKEDISRFKLSVITKFFK